VERLTQGVMELRNFIQDRLGLMGKDALKLKLAGSQTVYMNVSLEEVQEGLRMMEERLRNESETRFEGIQQKLENIVNQTEKGFRILESKLGVIEGGQADTRHTIVTSASQMQLNLAGTPITVEDRIKHTVSKGTNAIKRRSITFRTPLPRNWPPSIAVFTQHKSAWRR